MDRIELEERLIDFAVQIVKLTNELPKTEASIHLSRQLLRSGTSPALNYGEAQSAQSKKDFIHKMSLVLKELRESHICLKVIGSAMDMQTDKRLMQIINECDQLIAIFVRSLQTARGYHNR